MVKHLYIIENISAFFMKDVQSRRKGDLLVNMKYDEIVRFGWEFSLSDKDLFYENLWWLVYPHPYMGLFDKMVDWFDQ